MSLWTFCDIAHELNVFISRCRFGQELKSALQTEQTIECLVVLFPQLPQTIPNFPESAQLRNPSPIISRKIPPMPKIRVIPLSPPSSAEVDARNMIDAAQMKPPGIMNPSHPMAAIIVHQPSPLFTFVFPIRGDSPTSTGFEQCGQMNLPEPGTVNGFRQCGHAISIDGSAAFIFSPSCCNVNRLLITFGWGRTADVLPLLRKSRAYEPKKDQTRFRKNSRGKDSGPEKSVRSSRAVVCLQPARPSRSHRLEKTYP